MRENKGIQAQGMVLEALPGLLFKVKLDGGGEILAHLAGKMKIHYIRVIPGDKVIIEMPDEKSERGRIVRRL